MTAITILEVCVERLGLPKDEPRELNGADFDAADLAIMGGCEICGASIAAYNAHPSYTGYWRCSGCIGEHGFETVAQFEAFENATRAGGGA